MLFIAGAIVVDVVRDESEASAPAEAVETSTQDGETTVEDAGDEASSDLPRAYVITRSRDNPTILSSQFVELLSLPLEPGSYQVFAKLGVHNAESTPFIAECALVPSDRDGTPRGADRAGEHGSDYADIQLGPSGDSVDRAGLSLAISQVLDAPGSATLFCRGNGTVGARANYISIRAIEVEAIEAIEAPPP